MVQVRSADEDSVVVVRGREEGILKIKKGPKKEDGSRWKRLEDGRI
jgi:hypothetical protein